MDQTATPDAQRNLEILTEDFILHGRASPDHLQYVLADVELGHLSPQYFRRCMQWCLRWGERHNLPEHIVRDTRHAYGRFIRGLEVEYLGVMIPAYPYRQL